MKLYVFLVVLGLVSRASAINWKPCPGVTGTLNFEIDGCEGKRLCVVKRGQERSLSMRFKAFANSPGLTAVVLGKSRGMSSAMQLVSNGFDSNACTYLQNGGSCPIVKDSKYSYKFPLFLEKFFPPTTYMIQFSLKDSSSRTQSCGRTIIRLV